MRKIITTVGVTETEQRVGSYSFGVLGTGRYVAEGAVFTVDEIRPQLFLKQNRQVAELRV